MGGGAVLVTDEAVIQTHAPVAPRRQTRGTDSSVENQQRALGAHRRHAQLAL